MTGIYCRRQKWSDANNCSNGGIEVRVISILLGTLVLVGCTAFQTTADAPLFADDAEVRLVASGFTFTEGPASDRAGNLYFSDIPNNRIHYLSREGDLSVFRENSNATNGIFLDAEGRLVVCERGNYGVHHGQITRISPTTGEVSVLAERFQDKRFNSPNDLWITPDGGIYFSDPRYFNYDGVELDGYYIFYVPPNSDDVVIAIDDLVKPNGIIGSRDGETLYVADAQVTYAYDIEAPGVVSNRRVAAPMGSDGMTIDDRGNLYLTRRGVHIYVPGGEKLATIEVPEAPTNVTFAGEGHSTLFITAITGLYAIEMNVRGERPIWE